MEPKGTTIHVMLNKYFVNIRFQNGPKIKKSFKKIIARVSLISLI